MRSLTQTEMKNVTGGLRVAGGGGMHPNLYPAPGGGGNPPGPGVLSTIYHIIKYGKWTPKDIALDLVTAPGSNMTMAEASAAAGDLVWAAGALSFGAGWQIGTIAYNHMSPELQDAIGGTEYEAVQMIENAYHEFINWL